MADSRRSFNTCLAKFRTDAQTALQKQEKKIGNIAAYLAITLSRTPKRVKSSRPEKVSASLDGANYRAYPLKIWFPTPEGGIVDSGMTAEEYLKKIKGGYVARGSGKFRARRLKYHERSKFENPSFRMNVGSEYRVGLGSTRVTERTNRRYLKGSGRFSDEEREKVHDLKKQRQALRRKLWDSDRSRTARAYGALVRANNRIRDVQTDSAKKRKKHEEKRAANQQKYFDTLAKIQNKRAERMAKWNEKHVRYRIAAQSGRLGRNQTRDPQGGGLLRKGSTPGNPPKTWAGSGITNYYIGQRENGTDEMTGKKKWVNNYLVEKTGEFEYTISIRDLKGSGSSVLVDLEYGGSRTSDPILEGYIVTTRDFQSHRRVYFTKVKGKKKTIQIKKRPWFSPAIERVKQRYKLKS